MSLDSSILSYAVSKKNGYVELARAGITADMLTDDYEKAWNFLAKSKSRHGTVPSRSVLQTRYPDIELHKVRDRDLPIIVSEVRQRKKFMDFLGVLDDASRIGGPDDIDVMLATVQGELNKLSMRNGNSSMVDLFGKQAQERMLKDLKKRRNGSVMGIPTGFNRLDSMIGGMQRGRMIVTMARPGIGKSWVNLLLLASAVMHGGKVGLYPLEMTLEDVALRLYTVFSLKLFGADKVIRNLDLINGRVSKTKIVKLLNRLEDKYAGQFFLADIGSMSDSYTVERIEAEQEMYRFDVLWVDYITLMKSPIVGKGGGEDHTTIKALSNGLAQMSKRQNCVVGVSSQVSRQAISGKALIPRLEHISYGDALGQDADHVISMNKRNLNLYYALVKNRHGPESGNIRCKFAVDVGSIEEDHEQDDEEED